MDSRLIFLPRAWVRWGDVLGGPYHTVGSCGKETAWPVGKSAGVIAANDEVDSKDEAK
jgi:hypothetical protein